MVEKQKDILLFQLKEKLSDMEKTVTNVFEMFLDDSTNQQTFNESGGGSRRMSRHRYSNLGADRMSVSKRESLDLEA